MVIHIVYLPIISCDILLRIPLRISGPQEIHQGKLIQYRTDNDFIFQREDFL